MSLEILDKVQSEHSSQKNVTFQIKVYQRFIHKDILHRAVFNIKKLVTIKGKKCMLKP